MYAVLRGVWQFEGLTPSQMWSQDKTSPKLGNKIHISPSSSPSLKSPSPHLACLIQRSCNKQDIIYTMIIIYCEASSCKACHIHKCHLQYGLAQSSECYIMLKYGLALAYVLHIMLSSTLQSNFQPSLSVQCSMECSMHNAQCT